ncbi:efflux RND transporter permease subunit [bacterium CPR1]|nr:efflux RND transporter permease subunit [bacterium CPR1]
MRLVRMTFENPYLVLVGALAIVVLGVTVLMRIPVDVLPVFQAPAVQVLTLYPGMPTEVMERDITNRLERWTSQAVGISRQESRTLTGVSVVRDYFRSDIDPNAALSQVSSLAMSDLYYLPPGTIPPMVMPFDPTASQPLCLLAVSSETLDETSLYDVAYFEMRNLLSGTPGVIAPAVYGGRLRRILIYVERAKLEALGMSPMDVVNAVRSYNVLIPTGDANLGRLNYQVTSNAMVPEISALNDIPLRYQDGRAVLVRDVGQARDSYAIQTNAVRIGGKRAVYIPIYRQPGANTIQVVEGIRSALPGIQQRVTNGAQLKLEVLIDQSVYARESISGLVFEGALGAALAALVVLLFLGSVRAMLVITITLPLSLLCSVLGLYAAGQSLNVMTLGGLALAVGILMDNGIVVLENTARHLRMGKSPAEAAQDAAMEVADPVLVASLTLAVVFAPVTLLTGIGKFLFTPLALAVILAIAASYVMSMTVVPACATFLEHKPAPPLAERLFHPLQQLYEAALSRSLRARPLVLLLISLLFLASMALIPLLGTELFPQIDSGQLMVQLRAASGTRMQLTEELAQQAEAVVREVVGEPNLQMVVANVGILYDWPAAYTPNSGPHDAFLLAQLTRSRQITAQEAARRLRAELPRRLPGVEISVSTGGLVSSALNFGLPSPINVQVEGPSLATSRQIAEALTERIRLVPGAVDVRIQQRLDYPQIDVQVDRLRAASVGLTQEAVVQNIITALNSSTTFLPSFWIDERNGNHYFIGATYREEDIRSLETLQDIPITDTRSRGAIPLRSLATLGQKQAAVESNHVNIRRVIDVFANVDRTDVGRVAARVEKLLERARPGLPEGYSVYLRGEVSSMKESFANLSFGLALALVLLYLVMVVQFRSFADPLVVLLSAPVGWIGVALILLATGTTLNVQSFMGIIMMMGLAVAYSILMVDFANNLVAQGRDRISAVHEACSIRLRPILMTSLAALLGFLPVALDSSQPNSAMARAVIGGLLTSTFLKLFLVPILYTYLHKIPGRKS